MKISQQIVMDEVEKYSFKKNEPFSDFKRQIDVGLYACNEILILMNKEIIWTP